MKFTALVAAFAAGASAATTTVSGAAEGFAKGVTGGGTATPVFPTTIAQLSSYLSDSTPRVIVLNKTFDFRGTEGTTTDSGCAPFGTAAACQTAINKDNWCVNYEPDKPKVASITYDTAGSLGLTVASHKTIIGQDSLGIMYGKGLRIVSGATNIIIQNIKIAEINPQWVWGGDGITIDGADMVWIDHVTTEHISRQHIVLGTSASNRVTISNHYLNGLSDHSASCDGYHYWGFYLDGSNDLVTMKNNYIYHTSGRAPKVQGNTVLHAVNNYFQDNSGHAFEIGAGGYVVAEGNVFQNVKAILDTGIAGAAFASPSVAANTACKAYLGHNCELNGYGASGNFTEKTTSFFSDFTGKNVATAAVYGGVAASVVANAGFGKVTS